MTELVAATAAALAVVLLRPPRRWMWLARLGAPPSHDPSGSVRLLGATSARSRRLPLTVPAGAGLLWWVVGDGRLSSAIVVGSVVGLGAFIVQRRRQEQARRRVEETAEAVDAVIELVASEARGGASPVRSLISAAADVELLTPVVEVARRHGDLGAALTAVSQRPGAAALRDLGSAWRVAEVAGAPLSTVLDRFVEGQRHDQDQRRQLLADVAPARATAQLMAVLPVVGLALGSGLGADPVRTLLTTLPGSLCLAAGLSLSCLGLTWIDRMVDHATRA